MSEQIEIENLMPWGEAKRVETRNGARMLRTAPADQKFFELWRTNKEALKAAGISCAPDRNDPKKWIVNWWQPLSEEDRAKAEVERQIAAKKIEASRATATDLQIPRPDGLDYLPYQKAGIAFVQEAWNAGLGGLIGDEMGLGKTIQAIGLINCDESIRRVIIICPNTIKGNWQRELKKWLVRPMRIGIQSSGSPFVGKCCDIVIVNYDCVHSIKGISETQWDLRIIDEGQYCKSQKARRTKATLAIQANKKVTMTGTPILNRVVELWPLISDLDPKRWNPQKGFFRFARRYCGAVHNGYGWDFSGASNEQELQNILRSSIMVRRLKADVLTELPPKRRQVIELPSDGFENLIADEESAFARHQTLLEELQARVQLAKASEIRADYEKAVADLRAGQSAAFAEMAKLAHETALAKVPQVISYVGDALENGKVILFAHHLDVIAKFKEAFPKAAIIVGATKDRMAEVDRFQKDPACELFIGNDAAGEGITLTASTHVIFAEGDWVPGKLSQKEDRAHRIGQKESVLVTHLVMEGSLDAVKIRAVVEKQEVIDRCLDRIGDVESSAMPELSEPAFIELGTVKAINVTFEQVAEDAPKLSKELVARALDGMKRLAAMDHDFARSLNNMGFSKVDVRIGHSLAGQLFLSQKQAAIAARLCIKYKRQLGAEFVQPFYEALGLKNSDESAD